MLVYIKRRCSLVRAINEHGAMVERRVTRVKQKELDRDLL
jgi:hypothetical protein